MISNVGPLVLIKVHSGSTVFEPPAINQNSLGAHNKRFGPIIALKIHWGLTISKSGALCDQYKFTGAHRFKFGIPSLNQNSPRAYNLQIWGPWYQKNPSINQNSPRV